MPSTTPEEVVNTTEDISTTTANILTAADRVFGTAELLEMILQHCSAADCTRFQRLTTFCRAAIPGTSKILRRIMFLEPPTSEPELLTLEGEIISRFGAGQIMYPVLPSFHSQNERNARHQYRLPRIIGQVHPALGMARVQTMPLFLTSHKMMGVIIRIDGLGIEKWEKGCWEEMSITQPPCGLIHIQGKGKKTCKTLGQLRDAVVKRLKTGGNVKVCVHGFVEERGERVGRARARVEKAKLTERLLALQEQELI